MTGTFSQIYIQVVFAVRHREALIASEWEDKLYQYITGIVKAKGQKLIAINGTSNHVHMFIGVKPNCCLSDLVREIKKSSNTFVNDNKLSLARFGWQEGFGAFSYSHSQIDTVVQYIVNQKAHHKKVTFKEEYLGFLKKFQISFQNEYLFDWIE